MAERDATDPKTHWWQKESTIPSLLLWTGVFIIFLLLALLWTTTRHRSFSLITREARAPNFEAQLPSVAALSQGTLIEGNQIDIGINGEFFDRLLEDLETAEETIHLETFVWWDGPVTVRIAELLAEKARKGVEVRVLVDSSGGSEMTGEVESMMLDAGVQLVWFRPLRFGNVGRLNFRDHRKIIVIDGKLAYLFGHGIAQEWTGNAENKERYRDTYARIRGPIVNQIQGVFFENWVEETRDLPSGRKYFPSIEPAGSMVAHLAWIQPIGDISAVEVLHYAAIAAARKDIVIQNPYFVVEDSGLALLSSAVDRGVRVRVMLPSVEGTDNALVQHASHARFEELLEAGVEIWEYDQTLLHQKIMVIDGVWSAIGSTNFDDRSFELNDEIQIGILDEGIASRLLADFESDLKYAHQVDLEQFRNRSIFDKLKDWASYTFNEQL